MMPPTNNLNTLNPKFFVYRISNGRRLLSGIPIVAILCNKKLSFLFNQDHASSLLSTILLFYHILYYHLQLLLLSSLLSLPLFSLFSFLSSQFIIMQFNVLLSPLLSILLLFSQSTSSLFLIILFLSSPISFPYLLSITLFSSASLHLSTTSTYLNKWQSSMQFGLRVYRCGCW